MSAFAWIDFESGAKVNYTGSFASARRGYGLERALDDYRHTGQSGLESARRVGADPHFPPERRPVASTMKCTSSRRCRNPGANRSGRLSIGAQGHHYDLYHWRACIETGTEPETSGRDNLNTLALIFAAIEAADTGQTIKVCPPQV